MLYFETWIWVQTLNLKETYDSNVSYLLSLSISRIEIYVGIKQIQGYIWTTMGHILLFDLQILQDEALSFSVC